MIDEVMRPDSLGHMEGTDVLGPVEFKAQRAALLAAFPDLSLVVGRGNLARSARLERLSPL
jgi:hypothetical protein